MCVVCTNIDHFDVLCSAFLFPSLVFCSAARVVQGRTMMIVSSTIPHANIDGICIVMLVTLVIAAGTLSQRNY